MVKEEVTQEDIADVVAKWTGIPVAKMIQSQRERLLHLETELKNESLVKTAQSLRLAMQYVVVVQAFKTQISQWGVFCFRNNRSGKNRISKGLGRTPI